MQNRRFSYGVFIPTVGVCAMPVDDRTMVFDTQGAVHEQNDVYIDCENNGVRLGVLDRNGHHAVAGHIELFHHQVRKTNAYKTFYKNNEKMPF